MGFLHTGRQLSFVWDIADLYKAEITIPLAFRLVSETPEGADGRIRAACRDAFTQARLLKRILPDIDRLLGLEQEETQYDQIDSEEGIPVSLWSELFDLSPEASDDSSTP